MVLLLLLFSIFPLKEAGMIQNRNICSLFGTVYVEKDRNRADYRVYIEGSEAFADLIVYREQNRLFADKKGLWYFTANRSLANFTIHFVKERHSAHFTICYTEAATFAGCN